MDGSIRLTSKILVDYDAYRLDGRPDVDVQSIDNEYIANHIKAVQERLIQYDLWGVRYRVDTEYNTKTNIVTTVVTPLEGEYEKYLDRLKKKLEFLEIFS